jgi:hypothetical protein
MTDQARTLILLAAYAVFTAVMIAAYADTGNVVPLAIGVFTGLFGIMLAITWPGPK